MGLALVLPHFKKNVTVIKLNFNLLFYGENMRVKLSLSYGEFEPLVRSALMQQRSAR